jgi:hypothetical protein
VTDALRYPSHYPPTTRWKKFFIGVRWLGPDLAFFKELKAIQASRHAEAMQSWGGGLRQKLAELVARELCRKAGWKSAIFLPEDSLAVAINGPRFNMHDDFVLEDILLALKKEHGIALPHDYWANKDDMLFGQFIDDLVQLQTDGLTRSALVEAR